MKLEAELEKEAARLRQLLVELSRATQLLEKSEVGCGYHRVKEGAACAVRAKDGAGGEGVRLADA